MNSAGRTLSIKGNNPSSFGTQSSTASSKIQALADTLAVETTRLEVSHVTGEVSTGPLFGVCSVPLDWHFKINKPQFPVAVELDTTCYAHHLFRMTSTAPSTGKKTKGFTIDETGEPKVRDRKPITATDESYFGSETETINKQ
jgi:hypothetical protein